MTLGSLVLLIVFQSYGIWLKQFQHFEALWHASAIERIFTQFLRRDCLQAGYLGLRMRDRHFPVRSTFLDHRSVRQVVYGVNNVLARKMVSQEMSSRLLPIGETLILFHVPLGIGYLTQDQHRVTDPLRVTGVQGQDQSLVILSDHLQADRLMVTGISGEYWFHQQPLSKPYRKGAQVAIVQPVAYYLARPAQVSRESRGYALYRDSLRGNAEELIDGLKSLEYSYGWLTRDTMIFKRAAEMLETEWNFVQTIRVEVRSIYDQVKTIQVVLTNRRDFDFSPHYLKQ